MKSCTLSALLAALAVATVLMVSALVVIAPRAAQAQDVGFTGSAPGAGGQALLVTSRAMAVSELVTALAGRACTVEVLGVIEASAWVTYVSGAPPFVNARFPQTLGTGAPFYVRCAGGGDAGFNRLSARGGQSGHVATQVATRAASHATYDRFVLEFEGDVVPEYQIDYMEAVVACGSGAPVQLAGSAILNINLPQTYVYDPDTGEMTIPSRALSVGGPQLIEAREICAFEGQATWALGLTSRQGFRLVELTSPARLVIDIEHP